MARDPPLLASPTPTLRSPATVTIGHVQLRDVIICPRDRGIVNYVQSRSIIEHNLLEPEKPPYKIADLAFLPNTLASLPVPGTDHTLLAAGGQDAEIHLSLLAPEKGQSLWQFNTHLEGSINNSILLTSLSLTDSNESSAEPRMAVSNNDRVVMFFDVPVRSRPSTITQVGAVRFNVPVNHSSISPDGRTLLSVGDSSKVFLHRITGGAHVTAVPIATLTLPPTSNPFFSPALVASFSTAFSADGSKYAVASQEGAVAVWDVRSSKPLKVFPTDKTRGCSRNSASTSWLSEDPQEWSHRKSRGPGWSARNVKFGGRPGRELMVFTEHTSLIHVIDARTFETEEVLQMPAFPAPTPPRTTRARYGPPPPPPSVQRSPSALATANARIVRTLEDTFRIAAGPEPEMLVIPPLGDRAVEREVRRVLGHHGVPARFRIEEEREEEMGMEMDVDLGGEREEVRPVYGYAHPHSHLRGYAAGDGESEEEGEEGRGRECDLAWEDPEQERNIAGACFDPSGAYIYVASDAGVAEWGVRGAEKRWWVDGAWER
ncbi:WD40-repeat-containing domain protein [Mycena albidolilacea]|uniref:WD40-repeat-containing domain protein n=1 Tax=Mycena albidolilacea TaxID=1033008 RepID=A0AAD7F0E2_9AGAR|nr:WD40-repeat-containing domain protein [Mycena albidolilacea]